MIFSRGRSAGAQRVTGWRSQTGVTAGAARTSPPSQARERRARSHDQELPYLAQPVMDVRDVHLRGLEYNEEVEAVFGALAGPLKAAAPHQAISKTTPPSQLTRPPFCSNTAKKKSDVLFALPVKAHPVVVAETMHSLQNEGLPQVCFLGQSNVGKSSLLNGLLNCRDLARCSAFPGRTRHLFTFDLGRKLSVVDLPGYGLARVDHDLQTQWKRLIHHYCQSSPALQHLKLVICLVDASLGIQRKDITYWDQVVGPYLSKLVVLTKVDLLTPLELHRAVQKACHDVHDLNRRRLRVPRATADQETWLRMNRWAAGGAPHEQDEAEAGKWRTQYIDEWRKLLPYVHAVSSRNKCGLAELRAHIATHCGVVSCAPGEVQELPCGARDG